MSSSGLQICVIEDNKPISKLFNTLLNKSGFRAINFSNGESGLEWLRNNKAGCIVVDILLPDINGTDVLNAIREMPGGGDIPIIAVTGFANPDDREKYISLGFDEYISKPVDISTFVQQVKDVISNKTDK